MNENEVMANKDREAKQALLLWGIFILTNVVINGTIPFVLGVDMHLWTYSTVKSFLYNPLIYSGIFLMAPLILVKGWKTVRQPAFLAPLLVAVVGICGRTFFPPAAALVVLVLAYLHWRFNLAELGFQSKGWRGDILAILLIGGLYSVPKFFQPTAHPLTLLQALSAGLERLFTNPASTTENLFYFGFLAERLVPKTGRWLTPVLLGLMYMLHEMSNPEYWYEGVAFIFIFIGVTLMAMIYLWRRSSVVIWLGDGLGRFASRLF